MSRIEALTRLLKAAGADTTRHSGRTLLDHLIGTHDMLKAAGCDEHVCLAGASHSIYGTNAFTKVTIQHTMRHAIVRIIGPRAEKLAWTFSQIDRPRAIENGKDIDLMHVEAANLLEQGGSLDRWPNIRAAWQQQLNREVA